MNRGGRLVSVLLELLIPGAGSFMTGNRSRSALVFGGSALAGGITAGSAALGSAAMMWVGVALGCLARVLGLIGCFLPKRRTAPSTRELVIVLVAAAAVLLAATALVRSNVVEAFAVPSATMYPAISVGDRVMVSKVLGTPDRGDIIAFHAPTTPEITLLKRVVGLPGDRVEIQSDSVILNGNALKHEPVAAPCRGTGVCDLVEERIGHLRYRIAIVRDSPAPPSGSFVVPSGHVFVLGDNRRESLDSRSFGPVAFENVVGRYVFTWWSRGS